MKEEIRILAEVDNLQTAEQIKQILEDKSIYCVIESDNPASSVLPLYTGIYAPENISVIINAADLDEAIDFLKNTSFEKYIVKDNY